MRSSLAEDIRSLTCTELLGEFFLVQLVTDLRFPKYSTGRKSHKEKDLNGECKAFDGKIDIFTVRNDYQFYKTFCGDRNTYKFIK